MKFHLFLHTPELLIRKEKSYLIDVSSDEDEVAVPIDDGVFGHEVEVPLGAGLVRCRRHRRFQLSVYLQTRALFWIFNFQIGSLKNSTSSKANVSEKVNLS